MQLQKLEKRLEFLELRLAFRYQQKVKFLFSLEKGFYSDKEPKRKVWAGCTRQQYCLPNLPFNKKLNAQIISKALDRFINDNLRKRQEVIYTQADLEQLQKEWHLVITEYIKKTD